MSALAVRDRANKSVSQLPEAYPRREKRAALISHDESEAIKRLNGNLNGYRTKNKLAKAYYDGTVVPPALQMNSNRRRVAESAVGFAKIAVDAHTERLSLQGFVGPEGEDNPYGIESIVDENGLETTAGEVHNETLVCGTGFVTVGGGIDFMDPEVIISAHDSSYATGDFSLRQRRITQGLTVFPDDPSRGELLTPNSVIPFGIHQGKVLSDGDRIDHNLGRVPMVKLNNKPGAGSSKGRSEISVPMRSQIDFIMRTMDSIELNRELFAWGQRYLITDQEFKDKDGNPIDPFVAAMQAMWVIPNKSEKTPEIGTLPSNSPGDLLALISKWAEMFAAEAGLPETYFGVTPEANPTSADAIRAGEARLINTAADRTRKFTRAWSEVATLSVLVRDGNLPSDFRAPRPIWGDVSTISPGAAADRVMKLVSQGILQPSSRIVLSELGYNKAQQDQIIRENNAASAGMLRRLLEQQPPQGAIEGEIIEAA